MRFLRLIGAAALSLGLLAVPAPALASGGEALHTDGSKLLAPDGHEVHLNGVNWFGMETDTFAPHGLWARNYGDMLDQIAAAGFNTVRLPFSNQLLEPTSQPKGIDYQRNPDLQGMNGLQVLDTIVAAAGARGLNVLLDRHRPTAAGQSELWYTDAVPESRWIDDWVMLAQRYSNNPAVIGADLHNEPHGPATWGDDQPRTDWRAAAERAGNAILAANPNWLIVVEGVERYGNDWYWWGGNLAGAVDAPVRLSVPGRLVYSTHDYGPGVYWQRWFSATDFPANLAGIWRVHWAFLQQDAIAPVLVGEFGGRSVGSDTEGQWQRSLLNFLNANGVSYTYWAWNPDSGDTGGLLQDDWSTLDQSKLAMLSPDVAGQPVANAPGTDPQQQQPAPQPVTSVAAAPPAVPVAAAGPLGPFAPGGPFDPDLQHALGGFGGLGDPDQLHRQARERDERLYLAEFGKPWQYAVYATTTTPQP